LGSVADPDQESSGFLPLDLGWKKTGMNIPYHIYESLVRIFCLKIFEFFVANPYLVSGIEKSGSGIYR
jgi:hypothetical protein